MYFDRSTMIKGKIAQGNLCFLVRRTNDCLKKGLSFGCLSLLPIVHIQAEKDTLCEAQETLHL